MSTAITRHRIFLLGSVVVALIVGVLANILFTSSVVRRLLTNRENSRRLVEERELVPHTPAHDEIGQNAEAIANASRMLSERNAGLRESSAFLTGLITAVPGAFFATDTDGRTTFVTPHIEEMTGFTSEEVMGHPNFWERQIHKQDWEQLLIRFAKAVARRESNVQAEYRFLHRDGVYRWFSASTSFTYDAEGELEAINSYAWDISERKRTEEAIRDSEAAVRVAKEAAEKANLAKSQFLSRMSHELRTPLNSILGFAQLLEMEHLDDPQKESVQQISRGGRHLLALINDVLDIARIEEGRLSLSVEPVPVDEIVREAVQMIAPLAARRQIALQQPPPVGFHVQADRQRLRQILLNLLSNAVKYNHTGGRVQLAYNELDGDLSILVTDTGPGIAEELMPRLFSPFDRLGSERGPIEGTGLGLALTKRLIEAMGGRLNVESEVGRGSTFCISVPKTSAPIEATPEDINIDLSSSSDGHASSGVVLYVEDNLSNVKLVERIFLRHRPEVTLLPAMQARLGIELARQHTPDAIFLDLNLPDMSGEDVLRELRRDPRTSATFISILSADATPNQVDRLLDLGADEYMTKPIDVRRFLEVVDSVLRTEVSRAG